MQPNTQKNRVEINQPEIIELQVETNLDNLYRESYHESQQYRALSYDSSDLPRSIRTRISRYLKAEFRFYKWKIVRENAENEYGFYIITKSYMWVPEEVYAEFTHALNMAGQNKKAF
jgi:hypothetical protein